MLTDSDVNFCTAELISSNFNSVTHFEMRTCLCVYWMSTALHYTKVEYVGTGKIF